MKKSFKNKKVFITGITGFKGSWLALLLNKLGARVSGLGLIQENKDTIFYDGNIEDFAEIYIVDIGMNLPKEVVESIRESDYIFHLAAQPIVSEGYEKPFWTFKTNLLGTVNILEIIKDSERPITMINVASDRVYGSVSKEHKETDKLEGHEPYSLSKVFANDVLELFSEMDNVSKKLRLFNVRASNVIGGGDRGKGRIVPSILEAIKSNSTLELRNPYFVRPYVYVLDCLAQYLQIALYGTKKSYNISGLDSSRTVKELVESFNSQEQTVKWKHIDKQFGFEGNKLLVDNTLYLSEFGCPYICSNIQDISKRISEYEFSENKLDVIDKLLTEALVSYELE